LKAKLVELTEKGADEASIDATKA